MPRAYTVTFENVAVTAAQDFFELLAGDDKPCALIYAELGQSTELQDAAEEQLRLKLIRGHTTGGSGGSSATPVPNVEGDAASGATCEVNNTTIASAGTAVDLYAGTWNIRTQWVYQPTPEQYVWVRGTSYLTLRLMANPADSVSISGTFVFLEA